MLLYLHETDMIRQNIDPDDPRSDSYKRTVFYGGVDIAVVESVMTTIIKHKAKTAREQVRLAMLEAVSKYILQIHSNKKAPPPAPPLWIDWFDANVLLGQTAVAAGTTPEAPTAPGESQAKAQVLESDQKTGMMKKAQVVFWSGEERQSITN